VEGNRNPKRVLYVNLGTKRLRVEKNRWEDGRKVDGEGWHEKVHHREELKKFFERQGIVAFCTCRLNERMNVDEC
jgi:hypothetical protein